MSKTRYEEISAKQALNRVKDPKMPFNWSINPYRGCAHGCSFCYARAFQTFMGMGAQDEFQHHILVKRNAAEALEGQLSAAAHKFGHDIEAVRRHIGHVTIGTATDPYQPVEKHEEITRSCLKQLAKYRIATSITTRSPLVLRDLDILSQMEQVSVNISINTLDVNVIRKLEPASPHPGQRMETVRRLSEQGIRTGIFAAPVLPFLTDHEEQLDSLLGSAKEAGADFAMISMLRLSRDVKEWYMQTLKHHFPEVVSAYRKLYGGSAYADREYTSAFKVLAEKLLAKYDLSGMSGRNKSGVQSQQNLIAENQAPWAVSAMTSEESMQLTESAASSVDTPIPACPEPRIVCTPSSSEIQASTFEGKSCPISGGTAAQAPEERRRLVKLPLPSNPVSREELVPEIEQISFPF